MCLYITEHPKQKTAKENIKCYKVLAAYPEKEKTTYFTPYQDMQYYLGETIHEKGQVKRGYDYGYYDPIPTISGGCLHTFANLDQAIDFAGKRYPFSIHKEWVVVECIIPKGTKYYEGIAGIQNPRSSYASKVLHVTENIVYKTY